MDQFCKDEIVFKATIFANFSVRFENETYNDQ